MRDLINMADEDKNEDDHSDQDSDNESSSTKSEFKKSLGDAQEDVAARKMRDRTAFMDKVKFKLRNGWRHDEGILIQYFQSCVANWKVYKGEKKPKMVLKLQCIYRQAMFGDNTAPPPENMKSTAGLKWQAWTALKGTSQVVAKRRFITYLAEIDPMLIDVMPDEKPPDGFPRDRNDETICAKCNTKTGCSRPLLDGNKTDLRRQLFDFEYLHEPVALQKWIKNAMETQRCTWGVHVAIAKIDTKPFQGWFDKDENGGYQAYDGNMVMNIVRDLVHYHFEIGWDMQQNKDEYGAEAFNYQVMKVNRLQNIYETMSHERFVFEAPCKQNITVCNDRRKGDGGRNHTHPVTLDQPTHKDVATYDEVLELRQQCKNLGLKATTGIVQNVQERRDIYRARISGHFNAVLTSAKAREKNEARSDIHKMEKKKVQELSQKMLIRQCWDACHAMKMDQIMVLLKRGCDPNTESPRGLTPFLCAILTGATSDVVEELIKLEADINAVNKFGLTPLILACRLKEPKSIHILMRSGASALQDGGNKGGGRTAIHTCAEHGAEEELRIILDFVKDGGGDSLRIVRLLDAQSLNGDTALMLSARMRNGVMCRVLTSLGANPNIRNAQSRNACYIARNAGWTELADWLEKKVGAGVAKLETYSDLQYDKTVRYGALKAKEAIETFGAAFLKTVHKSTTQSPLGPPSKAQIIVAECGDRAVAEQRELLDKHQLYILRKDKEGRPFPKEWNINDETEKCVETLEKTVELMYDNIRKGISGPNTEAPVKVLPWTPLMCAAAMNDIRAVKLMIRNGSDPNYRNRDGMTPLMLAAELQCIEALVDMLIMGADLNMVDNQGFTALAYANALPLPSNMQSDGVAVLLDNDTSGTKKMNSATIIKLALKCGVGDLKRVLEENASEASRDSVINHYRFMRLLEAAGMKRVETLRHLHEQVATSDWRVEALPEEGKSKHREDFSETNSEAREREIWEMRNANGETQDDEGMRCPVCTLVLPCTHFFKADILKTYLSKQEQELGTTGSKFLDSLNRANIAMKNRQKKKKEAGQAVLDDAGIGDRKTDRSITFMKKYRLREMELDQKLLLRMEMQREEDERLQMEEEKSLAKAKAIADGTYKEWQELFNTYGQKYFVHTDTGDKWEEHLGTDGNPYYHNPATGESKWESPVPKLVSPALVEETEILLLESAVEEQMKTVKLKMLGESETSAKALSTLDLSTVVPVSAPITARKTYNLPSQYKKKSALKGARDEYFIGPDGTATNLALEDVVNNETPSHQNSVKGRKVMFKDIPGDDVQPFEYPDLEKLPLIEWNQLKKVPRGSDPLLDLAAENESQPVESEPATDPILVRSNLGVDDDLQSISSSDGNMSKGSDTDIEHLIIHDNNELSKLETNPIKEKLRKMAINPLPPKDRRLFMFTMDPITRFGQSDGLLFAPKEAKPALIDTKGVVARLRRLGTPVPMHLVKMLEKEEKEDELIKQQEKERAAMKEQGKEPEKPKPMPFYPSGAAARKQVLGESDPQIQVSGWLFLSLEAIETSIVPQERIRLNTDIWARIIEHVREKLLNDWLPRCNLEPLISPKTWKVDAPRCSVCSIGFVRMSTEKRQNELFKGVMRPKLQTIVGGTVYDHVKGVWMSTEPDGSFEYSEYNLCFPCLVRRELYEKVQATFPRNQRSKMAANSAEIWPFKHAGDRSVNSNSGLDASISSESSPSSKSSRLTSGFSASFNSSSSSIESSYSNVVDSGMNEIMASIGIDARTSFIRSAGNSFSIIDSSFKSPTASKKLAALDSIEIMRQSGKNLKIGYDDETASMGSGSFLTDIDMTYFDDLGDTVSVSSDGGSMIGSPAGYKAERLWDDTPINVYESAAEKRARSKEPEKKLSLREKLQFGKKKEPLFNKSIDTLDSSLNGAINGPTSLSLLSIPSQFSGSTAEARVPPKTDQRRPPEILLIPYLISRGHFEEVERSVRISISRKSVDEGEGMILLLKVFHLQADMYKLMGLFPLALAVYLDCVDLTASLLGFGDPATTAATICVSSCLRKMHMPAMAKTFIANFGHRLEEETFSNRTFAASKLILECDRKFKKSFMKMEEIWTKMVFPDRPVCSPLRSHSQIIWDTIGLGALYRCMSAVDGYGVVGRTSFIQHCDRVDPNGLGRYAQFVAYCFRLRLCDSPEIFRHLVQTLIQKHLAKSLVKTSEVARIYRHVTPPEHIQSIIHFLKDGIAVGVDAFDDMLYYCLKALVPAFKIFYLRHGGAGMRDCLSNVENTALAIHGIAVVIQLQWRCKLAKMKISSIKLSKAETQAKQKEDERSLAEEIARAPKSFIPNIKPSKLNRS